MERDFVDSRVLNNRNRRALGSCAARIIFDREFIRSGSEFAALNRQATGTHLYCGVMTNHSAASNQYSAMILR